MVVFFAMLQFSLRMSRAGQCTHSSYMCCCRLCNVSDWSQGLLSKMDKLVDIGLIKQGEEENLYNNMLARIANSDLSSRNLSVSVVDALSSLVFLVKNKWKDKVPSTHLTKKQFVHILAYICDRRSTLEEQEDMKIRSIWRPNICICVGICI